MLLKEKIIRYSSKSSEYELLSVLFGKKTAIKIIETYGCFNQIKQITKNAELSKLAIAKIQAFFELERRFEKNKILIKAHPENIYNHFAWLSQVKQEHLYVLALDSQSKVMEEELIYIGTLTSSIVHPRDIFRWAIEKSAYRLILVHNHPAGVAFPSKEDKKVTIRLLEAGKLIGIEIIDHIIIGKDNYFSFNKMGLID